MTKKFESQSRYSGKKKPYVYKNGSFCKFKINVSIPYVYAWVHGEMPIYIGSIPDLKQMYNATYGNISPGGLLRK